MLVERFAAAEVSELLATFRVVVVAGARQVGKSTLAMAQLGVPAAKVFSLDDPDLLARLVADPVGVVHAMPHGSVIDEFQRGGEPLLLAVKRLVDQRPDKGQFILTGSANYLAARGVTETLAGRTGRLQLRPLSISERCGWRSSFVDWVFEPGFEPPTMSSGEPAAVVARRSTVIEWLLEGGFPEIVRDRLSATRRARWFDAYVADVVNREALRPIADVRYEAELRRVLRALAARLGGPLVLADLSRDLGLDRETVANYVSILEAVYLVELLPGFATSAATAVHRRPRIQLADSGLAAHLAGVGERDLSALVANRMLGPLVEQFVVGELCKQLAWSEGDYEISYYRDREQREVDLVIEHRSSGRVAAIEVKASSSPDSRAARHLAFLRDRLGDRFAAGLVLHLGAQSLPLGDRLWSVPVAALWGDTG